MNRVTFPGQVLRSRREELGLSFADVFEAIHVPIEHLRALESGEVRGMPAPTYTLGFLKTYCEFLGLDPQPLSHAFRQAMPAPKHAPVHRRVLPQDNTEGGRPAWVNEALAWGTVCMVLLVGWLAYSIIVEPLVEDSAVRVEASTMDAPKTPSFKPGE